MKCAYVKQNGTHCKANALKTCSFCFSHSPKTVEAKRLAVVKGGENSRVHTQVLEKLPMQSSQDLVEILTETLHQLRICGSITPIKAKVITNIVRLTYDIHSGGTTEADIAVRMRELFAERAREVLEENA